MLRTLTIERLRAVRLPDDWTRWIVALLFAGLAVQSARLLWVLVTPAGPVGDWRPAMPAPVTPERRAAIFSSVNPFGQGSGAAQATALPNDLKLFGVRAAAGALQGGAIIQLPDGQQISVSVGETVMPGVQLVAVGFDFADVAREGGRQRLFLDQDKAPEAIAASGAAQPSSGAAAPAAQLDDAVSLSPRMAGTGLSGILVAPGSNAAAFAASGLKAGDVILSVNGATVSSIEDLSRLQQGVAGGGSFSLQVERGGAVVPVTINIASKT